MKTLAALVLGLFVTSQGVAQELIKDGRTLVEAVEAHLRYDSEPSHTERERLREMHFVSYTRGAVAMAMAWASVPEHCPFAFPEELAIGQVARVLKKYADAHPEELHHPPMLIFLNAFSDAFPNRDYKLPVKK